MSAASLSSLEDLLDLVDRKLRVWSLSPKNMASARRNAIDIQKLNPKAILSHEDLSQKWKNSESLSGDELYIPGDILCVWNHTQDASILGVNNTYSASPLISELLID